MFITEFIFELQNMINLTNIYYFRDQKIFPLTVDDFYQRAPIHEKLNFQIEPKGS